MNDSFRSNQSDERATRDERVLFVGLGTMGLPMASNVVRAGLPVAGLDANSTAVERFVGAGGRAASDADIREADFIVTMVPDDAAVRAVLGGENGLIARAKAGAMIVEMSTTAPSTKTELAAKARRRGVAFIEAPVGRTMEHAIAGTLALMIGGNPALVEKARPLLSAMGSELHLCGDVGAGSALKLINNALVAAINAASIEALVAGRKANLELETIFSVLKTTMAWNNALAKALPNKALRRDFKPGFMTRLQHKDVGLALQMGRELDVPMPQAQAAYDVLARAIDTGFGGDDGIGSMLRVVEADGGVTLEMAAPAVASGGG